MGESTTPQRPLPGLLNGLPRIKITAEMAPNRRASEAANVAYSIRSAEDLGKALRLKTRK